MDTFLATFEAVLALLGIGVIGFWIIARRILPEEVIGVLSPLVIDIAMPCLIFSTIMTGFDPARDSGWWGLPLWWAGFTLVYALLTIILLFTVRSDIRAEFGLTLFYQNGIYVPLAVLAGLHGPDNIHMVSLFLFTIFYPAFFFNTYFLFFRKRGTAMKLNWRRIRNPILIATLFSAGLKLTGTSGYVPGFVLSLTSILGKMALPLIILIIGGSIYIDFKKREPLQLFPLIQFLLYRNILFPAMALLFIAAAGPDYRVSLILVLQASAPPLTAVPLVAEQAGGSRGVVNQFLVASFIFSALTMPLSVWLLHMIIPN